MRPARRMWAHQRLRRWRRPLRRMSCLRPLTCVHLTAVQLYSRTSERTGQHKDSDGRTRDSARRAARNPRARPATTTNGIASVSFASCSRFLLGGRHTTTTTTTTCCRSHRPRARASPHTELLVSATGGSGPVCECVRLCERAGPLCGHSQVGRQHFSSHPIPSHPISSYQSSPAATVFSKTNNAANISLAAAYGLSLAFREQRRGEAPTGR